MKMKTIKRMLLVFILLPLLQINTFSQKDFTIYGYSSLYYEKGFPMSNAPSGTKADPGAFDFAHFNLMMQSTFGTRVKAFVNITGIDNLEVRNYWGEYIFSDKLKIRTGKIYRPFDQFNELLDAVPTYLGMEPPELFDKDHLLVPRTGKIMVHGGSALGSTFLRYAYMLDSDEQFLTSHDGTLTLSHTWDLNISLFSDRLLIGHSGYIANEQNGTSVGLGDGSPNGGVLPWMTSDKYNVLGGYMTATFGNLKFQAAYWLSSHNAVRDTAAVITLYNNTDLNDQQMENFFGPNFTGTPTSADVITKANYKISTYYLRLGYTIAKEKVPLKFAEITPYVFLDYYSNPETIAAKQWGGDNEAGVADDGKFTKLTVGIAIRPTTTMALKIDGGPHIQTINGEKVHYSELRMDISYMF
jgi:hypothetical protein